MTDERQTDLDRALALLQPLTGIVATHAYMRAAYVEVADAIAEALRAERERCCRAIRERCEACGGSGYGTVRYHYNEHGMVIDGDECMYCGVPIAAIRVGRKP